MQYFRDILTYTDRKHEKRLKKPYARCSKRETMIKGQPKCGSTRRPGNKKGVPEIKRRIILEEIVENTELAVSEETSVSKETEDKSSLCSFEFNVTIPEEDDAFKVFQRRYVFKRNVIKSIGFGLLGIGFLVSSFIYPDKVMNYILFAVCAANPDETKIISMKSVTGKILKCFMANISYNNKSSGLFLQI